MKITDLVSLDCTDGSVRRYRRVAGNHAQETGRARFSEWDATIDEPGVWGRVWQWLQAFRTGYEPPEDPAPRPTAPMRTAMAA